MMQTLTEKEDAQKRLGHSTAHSTTHTHSSSTNSNTTLLTVSSSLAAVTPATQQYKMSVSTHHHQCCCCRCLCVALAAVLVHTHTHMQGTRPLVMPVNKEGNALKTLKKGDEDDDETANPFSTSSFTPQSATDGNSVATQLAAVKSMDGDLDGTGQLVCVIDTGIAFVGNPSYGECKALNTPKGKCRVVTGYDFVGDAFTGLQTGPSAVRGGMPVRGVEGLEDAFVCMCFDGGTGEGRSE